MTRFLAGLTILSLIVYLGVRLTGAAVDSVAVDCAAVGMVLP